MAHTKMNFLGELTVIQQGDRLSLSVPKNIRGYFLKGERLVVFRPERS